MIPSSNCEARSLIILNTSQHTLRLPGEVFYLLCARQELSIDIQLAASSCDQMAVLQIKLITLFQAQQNVF